MTAKPEQKHAQDKQGASDKLALAGITLLYESRDGKLCLFEDADGHLVAVRTALLA